jgi:hypothetical protein
MEVSGSRIGRWALWLLAVWCTALTVQAQNMMPVDPAMIQIEPPPAPPLDNEWQLPPARKAPAPPPTPRWNHLAGSLSVLALGNERAFVGADLSVFGVLALRAPTPAPNALSGWLLFPGLQVNFGKVQSTQCGQAAFCADRFLAGVALKGGWANGHAGIDGGTRAETLYYAQLEVLGGRYNIPPAPLSRAASSWEGLARFRLGLHWSSQAADQKPAVLTVNASAMLEWVALSTVTKGVSFGGCLGVSF